MKTIICLIIDESGSMLKNKEEIIRGYNNFIREQTKLKGDASFFFVKFNSRITIYYSNEKLSEIPTMTDQMYIPKGGTALYDAIIAAINDVDKYKKRGDRVICVIMTDGEDNHSISYKSDLKEMIEWKMAKENWSFVYIGECAQEFAKEFGISPSNVAEYLSSIEEKFENVSIVCTNFRSN